MTNNTDDPFAPRDSTVIRPRPGAGRRASNEPSSFSPRRPESVHSPEPPPVQFGELFGAGLNPLLQAANPLLVLAGRVRTTLAQSDIDGLRRQALEAIRIFEERAGSAGVRSETVLAARYALCATLDEAVLSTPWGAQGDWASQTLLVTLHREAWGGEKFFEMLERISRDPARHIDLMELQYACLALGFTGKFQVLDRGQNQLADIQRDLYQKIRAHRGTPESELSLHWRGVENRRNRVIRYVPWWVVGAAALVALTGAFIYFHTRLGALASPVHEQLAQVGLDDFKTPAVGATPPEGPRLKELLAEDVAQGVLDVEESANRTVITLVAPDLFASGSANVNPARHDVLARVTNAIDQVPGRVLVVGHTDDSPLRSFRYKDNYELSRERAVHVVKIMKLTIDDPSRLEWTGVGPSQPKYTPPSLPENRARNRRVEIVHVAQG
jgi:type VI secretion system protein ImpK